MYGTLCVHVAGIDMYGRHVAGLICMVRCVCMLLGLICMVGCVCMLLD